MKHDNVCLYLRSAQHSVETQRQQLQSLARRREMRIACEIAECCSGNTSHRAGLTELLRRAEAGEFKIVLVSSLSRFSRRTEELITIMRKLRDIGIEVWTADTNNPVSYEQLATLETLSNLKRWIMS